MKCKNCGKNNDNDAKYCKNCGSELKKDKIFDINKRLEDLEEIKNKLKLEEKIESFINQEEKFSGKSNKKSKTDKVTNHDYANEEVKFDDKKENSKENNFLSNLTPKFPISYKLIGILLIGMLILGPIFSKFRSNDNDKYDYEEPVAIDVKSYDTTIRIKSSVNLLFSTYDIKIYVDGIDQAVIKNGEETEFTLNLDEGSHNLKITKASDESIFGQVNFDVNDNNKLQFKASSHSDNIEIESEDYVENVVEEAKEKSPTENQKKEMDETTDNINEDNQESETQPTEESTEEIENNEEEVITIDNNEDFKKLLSLKNEFDPFIGEFSEKYYGKTIEFNGNIGNIQNFSTNNKTYKTRFNVLIQGGDFEPDSVSGPNFRFTNISGTKLPSGLVYGDNVKIKAKVGTYNKDNSLFELENISIERR